MRRLPTAKSTARRVTLNSINFLQPELMLFLMKGL